MSRKGVTPVIGAVLLISISVAASVSAFTFLNDLKLNLQENSEQKIKNQKENLQKNMNIEFVYNSTDGYTLMSVRNTGEIALLPKDNGEKIWSQFVDGTPRNWNFTDSDKQSAETVSLDPQATVTINTTAKYPPANTEVPIELSGDDVSDTHVCYHTGGSSC